MKSAPAVRARLRTFQEVDPRRIPPEREGAACCCFICEPVRTGVAERRLGAGYGLDRQQVQAVVLRHAGLLRHEDEQRARHDARLARGVICQACQNCDLLAVPDRTALLAPGEKTRWVYLRACPTCADPKEKPPR